MKFLIFAAIVVTCVFAEPEAKPEAEAEAQPEAQYYGFNRHHFGGSYYRSPYYSGSYGKTYNGYGVWPYSYTPGYYNRYAMTGYNRMFKREAEAEAEPEAEGDAQFYYQPGFYRSMVNTPFTYGMTYNHYTTPYTAYNTPYTGFNMHRLYKREAEAEPESDAQYYRSGFYNYRFNRPYTYGTYGGYMNTPYTYGYQRYQNMPYTYNYNRFF